MNNIVVSKELITHTIENLERVGCQFDFCPGPNVPFEDMHTCYVCSNIQDLKEAIKDK